MNEQKSPSEDTIELFINNLSYAIIKQACLDYWADCKIFDKLPKRKKRLERRKNVYRKHIESDAQYYARLAKMEAERKDRKAEELRFFSSDWYRLLSGTMNKPETHVKEILDEIERRRREGIRPFGNEDDETDEQERGAV